MLLSFFENMYYNVKQRNKLSFLDFHITGVMLNSQPTMSAQVGAACGSVYNYLRQLRPVVRVLSVETRKTVVHAFVSSRLDYCNSLLFGVTDAWFNVFKLFKMLPHVSSVALADPSTSHQY